MVRTSWLAATAVLAAVWLAGCGSETDNGAVVLGGRSVPRRCLPPRLALFFSERAPAPPQPLPGSAPGTAGYPVFAGRTATGAEPAPSRSLGPELAQRYELASYYPGSLRAVPASGGAIDVVVAFARNEPAPSAECAKLVKHAFPSYSPRDRISGTTPLYCFVDMRPPAVANGEPGCGALDEVAAAPRVFAASFVFHAPVVDLVPAGVAAVRVTFPEHAPIVAQVKGGSFELHPPSAPPPRLRSTFARLEARLSAPGEATRERVSAEWNRAVARTRPVRVEWLAAGGGVLRSIAPPSSSHEVVAEAPVSGG